MADVEVPGAGKEYPLLWWTKWFDETWEEGKVVDYCGLPYTCRFTLDRSVYDETKVVIFQASRFKAHDVPSISDVKSGEKAWVLNTQEAPKDFQIKSRWTGIFTHLWSYSFESDFVWTYFNHGRAPGSLLSMMLRKPKHTIEEKNAFRESGLAPVAWFVSSCTSENGRHYYVKHLLKYIDIDIYGDYGTLYTEYENVGRYKFYLSFENTSCNDYVSEKIGRPYDAGVVPIVDGPKDYSRFMATNHSLIRIDSFATPEQLAMRIHELDKDDAKYLTYLDYKTQPEDKPLDQFMMPEMLKTFDLPEDAWGPDDRGARCGVCKLAHDMSEGLYQFNPNKTIGVDTTCSFGKWAFNTWAIEFYAWLIALIILGFVVVFFLGSILLGRRNFRRRAVVAGWSVGSWWKQMDKDTVGQQEYTKLAID